MAGVQCMVFAINLFKLYDIELLIVLSLVQSSS